MNFNGPIPGESLTKELGNSPWEQPPLTNTVTETFEWYMDRLGEPETIDDFLFLFEQGMTIEGAVDSLTTMGQMEGIHSVDIKILVSPILHEYLKSLADAADIKYKEMNGPTEEEKVKTKLKERSKLVITKALSSGEDSTDNNLEQEMVQEELPLENPGSNTGGIIKRR